MKHYVYMITNNLNNKMYIGKRSCKCSIEDDIYMGSGVAIGYAIKKYGIENFRKDILKTCISAEEAYSFEEYLVTKNVVDSDEFYNLRCGGFYGTFSEEHKKKISETCKKRILSEEHKKKISEASKGRKLPPLSEEVRKKISEALKGKPLSEETRKKMSGKRKQYRRLSWDV